MQRTHTCVQIKYSFIWICDLNIEVCAWWKCLSFSPNECPDLYLHKNFSRRKIKAARNVKQIKRYMGFFYSINVERISSSIHLILKCVAYCGNCLICISKYFLMPQYCSLSTYDARSAIFSPKFFVKRNNKSLFIFFSGCCKTLQILHGERSRKYQFYCHCFSGKWLKNYFLLFYSYYFFIY